MNNTLAPVKGAPTSHIETSRPPKLEAIPTGRREEPKEDHRSEPAKVEERAPAPTRQVDAHPTTNNDHDKYNELLKGKPIIFVGGGPGEFVILLIDVRQRSCCVSRQWQRNTMWEDDWKIWFHAFIGGWFDSCCGRRLINGKRSLFQWSDVSRKTHLDGKLDWLGLSSMIDASVESFRKIFSAYWKMRSMKERRKRPVSWSMVFHVESIKVSDTDRSTPRRKSFDQPHCTDISLN